MIRKNYEDFSVTEHLGYDLSGEGEHVFLFIEKKNTNTQWVADRLTEFAKAKKIDVGYAGLKDRRAVTRQWFSVMIPPSQEPDWTRFGDENITVLNRMRHTRKLRRGALKRNNFELTLREIKGEMDYWECRLNKIAQYGVPNYFGEQRFGHSYSNLEQAGALIQGKIKIKDRFRRGLAISAARSMIFNKILSKRIDLNNWNQAVDGDVFNLDGRRSVFYVNEIDQSIQVRMRQGEIHPTGALWGSGPYLPQTVSAQYEQEALEENGLTQWSKGLERFGLKHERRALRVMTRNLRWQWLNKTTLQLSFDLPKGCYATSVLRELTKACVASYSQWDPNSQAQLKL